MTSPDVKAMSASLLGNRAASLQVHLATDSVYRIIIDKSISY